MYLTPIAKALVLTGNVYDSKTEKLIPSPKIVISSKTDKRAGIPAGVSEGRYDHTIPRLGKYMISASAEGYLNTTDSVSADNEERSPFSKDIYLQPIEVGLTVRLKNIYFAFDKTELKKESFVELNKVVSFLKENSTVSIEIAGHTDNKGSDEYNETLSQGRSQSVVNYLISQGIDSERLSAHGYGESKPIDTNDTEDGQANNRRVEFTVLKK
jgi:outer membrane protein OmpA-like peptidoglycan-associated protein